MVVVLSWIVPVWGDFLLGRRLCGSSDAAWLEAASGVWMKEHALRVPQFLIILAFFQTVTAIVAVRR